uniref:NADH dehydrogenase subunit 2 n=1 Tax=Carychium tridentatum TaxID=145635 RepID=UPI0025A9FC9D|nr:NADH dehydrogenase subunit 2 [Carychium tridentatum]WIV81385.1 NADH dehydrogenase subunit 2 [Carychium tridentatum]
MMFFFMLISGPMISLSSSNWTLCWAGMEIGFLGLIPLLFLGGVSTSKESAMKYFLVQAFASALLFFLGMMIFMFEVTSIEWKMGFFLMLTIKLGMFPGHFWVVSVIQGMGWVSCCLILAPLKLPPLFFTQLIIEQIPSGNHIILFLASVSTLIGAFLGNNQTNVRAMIGASSITHSGWMVIGSVVGGVQDYLGFYFLVLFMTLFFFWELDSMMVSLMILSMSGLPPFMMFIGKLVVIMFAMMVSGGFMILSLPLLSAVLSLIFYLKFSYSFVMKQTKMTKSIRGLFLFFVMNFSGVLWIML